MASQSLAVKYRPQSFDDMTEQGAIKSILTNQINTKTFKHGYLFTGPAGTGKTTSARIFADMINDKKGNPIEIDAASNSGVDNIRNIIDDAKRKPLDAEYKVFIIDECHSLSSGAWQALLKTLEEPPKFSIFILCTTDPQKIPNTILSRVQRYNFQKISNEGIVQRLRYILYCEEKIADNDAVEYIAKSSNGGCRDAITLLDKCLSLSNELTLENVLKTIGAEDYDTFLSLCTALTNKNEGTSISLIEQIYNSGKDVKQFMKEFSKFLLDVAKYTIYGDFKYVSLPQTMESDLQNLSSVASDVFSVIDFVVALNNQIKWDNDPKTLVELSILTYCRKE